MIKLKRAHRGYSLIEMMVTISIFVIIMMSSMSLVSFLSGASSESQLSKLEAVINYAKTQARINSASVVICSLDSTATGSTIETPVCKSSTAWGVDPIVAFLSIDGSTTFDQVAGDKVVAHVPESEHGYIASNRNNIEIQPNAFVATSGAIHFCDNNGQIRGNLRISRVGTVTLDLSATGTC